MTYGYSSRAPRGMSQWMNRRLRAHPVLLPAILVAVGLLFLALGYFGQPPANAGEGAPRVSFFPVICFIIGGASLVFGLLIAPIGAVLAIRRRSNPLVLKCPSCGITAGQTREPFRIDDVPGFEYRMVRCPRCKWEFTIDKYARIAQG